MHVVMMVIGVPPEHIQQGSKVVLGKTPAKIAVTGVSPAYAVHVVWGNP